MLTVVLDDFTVHIIDIETRKIVRRFTGHSSTLTDVVRFAHIKSTMLVEVRFSMALQCEKFM